MDFYERCILGLELDLWKSHKLLADKIHLHKGDSEEMGEEGGVTDAKKVTICDKADLVVPTTASSSQTWC